jgi:plastocyanin
MRKTTLFLTSAMMMAAASSAAAAVKGTVSLQGNAPAETPIDMASDPKCKGLNPKPMTDDNQVKGGKVQNAFVYVKNAPKGDYKPEGKVTLDQKGCMYHPKMLGIMVGQDFEIINSDPTLHNVHAYAKPGEFNQAMPKKDQKITKKFKKQQVPVEIKCDVHKWMHADAGVVDHPFFAVTGADGSYSIDKALPDGEYEVEAFHATLGRVTGKVTVAGGNGTLDLTLPGK